MTTSPSEQDDTQLRRAASAFPYPPTPPIAAAVRERLRQPRASRRPRMVRITAVALVIVLGLLAVPPARAALWQVLQIGAIRIVPIPPTTTPPLPTPLSAGGPITPPPTAVAGLDPTAVVTPSPTPLRSVLDLAGETTLEDARDRVGFTIRLPAYPADLGAPDRVFVQDLGGPLLILAWLDPDDPSRVRLSLHAFGPGTFAEKMQPQAVRETTVNGQRAVWARGPHLLQSRRGDDYVQRRLVNGHVLIWTAGDVTYRLETTLPEAEAIRVAESLR